MIYLHTYLYVNIDTHIINPRKKEILLFVTTWVNFRDNVVTEINKTYPNTTWPHLNKQATTITNISSKFKDIQHKLLVARGRRQEVEEYCPEIWKLLRVELKNVHNIDGNVNCSFRIFLLRTKISRMNWDLS